MLICEQITLEVKLPRQIDGDFQWSTTSANIRLMNEQTQFVRVFGETVSQMGTFETIELRFMPKNENAFPTMTFSCMVTPSPLSIKMTDSTGAIITQGLVIENDTITIEVEGPSGVQGVFNWETESTNISLSAVMSGNIQKAQGKKIPIQGLVGSTYKGEESVKLTFTPFVGETLEETVLVTVVKGAFKESSLNRYGFDEMSGGANDPPHVCVASGQETWVKLSLSASGLSTDALNNEIVIDVDGGVNNTICTVGLINKLNEREYDVQIFASADKKSEETTLSAYLHRADGPVVASVIVNRYAYLTVDVFWGRFYDSTSATTSLGVACTTQKIKENINKWANRMCVSVNLKYCPGVTEDQAIDVNFDLNQDGVLEYTWQGTSVEQQKILDFFSSKNAGNNGVILVKKMETLYRINGAVSAGVKVFDLTKSSRFFTKGNWFQLKGKTPQGNVADEWVQVDADWNSAAANQVTVKTGLTNSYADSGLVFPAVGWSGHPIYLQEHYLPNENEIAETMLHEIGHAYFALSDVTDQTNVMYKSIDNTGTRLRFLKMTFNYPSSNGTTDECQWNTPDRSKA